VIELRQPVPHHQLLRHADLRERLALELVGIDDSVRLRVEHHVDDRRGEILDRREALVERAGLLDLGEQRLRHRLPGLVVAREAAEDLGGQQPILVHLARIFHEVALRTAERRIFHVDQEVIDGVTEFVDKDVLGGIRIVWEA